MSLGPASHVSVVVTRLYVGTRERNHAYQTGNLPTLMREANTIKDSCIFTAISAVGNDVHNLLGGGLGRQPRPKAVPLRAPILTSSIYLNTIFMQSASIYLA